jgi:hypothetical protein
MHSGGLFIFAAPLGRIPKFKGWPMTLREAEQRRARHQRKHRKRRKRKITTQRPVERAGRLRGRGRLVGIGHNLGPPLAPLLDDRVLTFAQWCALNSLGERTGRRILQSGSGPAVVQLSERRIGVTVRENRRWQQARER